MSEDTREILATIDRKLKIATDLINECKKLADKHGLYFQYPVELIGLSEHHPSDWYNSDNCEWRSSDDSCWN
jgi:hypothetical protein